MKLGLLMRGYFKNGGMKRLEKLEWLFFPELSFQRGAVTEEDSGIKDTVKDMRPFGFEILSLEDKLIWSDYRCIAFKSEI